MAMAACAVGAAAVCVASSSSSPLASNGRFHGTRGSSSAASTSSRAWGTFPGAGSREGERPGFDSCSSSGLFGRSSFQALSGRFPATAARSSGGRRNVVCEVAVSIGDAHSSEGQEAKVTKEITPGTKIKVKVPVTLYHVMKSPNLNIQGLVGEVKEVLGVYKGKTISANLPFKAQFSIEVDGNPVKFFAHLKDDEFEVLD